jgi:hypothetical protein
MDKTLWNYFNYITLSNRIQLKREDTVQEREIREMTKRSWKHCVEEPPFQGDMEKGKKITKVWVESWGGWSLWNGLGGMFNKSQGH